MAGMQQLDVVARLRTQRKTNAVLGRKTELCACKEHGHLNRAAKGKPRSALSRGVGLLNNQLKIGGGHCMKAGVKFAKEVDGEQSAESCTPRIGGTKPQEAGVQDQVPEEDIEGKWAEGRLPVCGGRAAELLV
eukprot:945269-Ditylum_brightwellii.AAC.1